MKYQFECECGAEITHDATPSELEGLKEDGVECPHCEGMATYSFTPGDVDVCFRGGGWRDKSLRERRYRKNRSKKMAKRQAKHHKAPELQPNFEGQRTESWREAQTLAEKADGYFAETYDDKVESED